MEFPPCCPDGRITNSCARRLYRERVEGFIRLGGARGQAGESKDTNSSVPQA